MNRNIKESKLLNELSKNDDYVSAGKLAKSLDVSTKTVHRMIESINNRSSKITILSKIGKGFKLSDDYLNQERSIDVSEKELSPQIRRNTIILKLLFKSPLKQRISYLFDSFYLSDSSVKKDIQIISDFLLKRNIALKRKGNYIWVSGEETNIRFVINKIILDSNMEYQIKKNGEQLIPLLYYRDLNFARHQIEYIEECVGITLLYPYSTNLLYHICMLINRFRDGKVNEYIAEFIEEEPKTDMQKNLFDVSKRVINSIEKYLNQKLPEEEAKHIYIYLVSSRLQEQEDRRICHETAKSIVAMYIDIVEKLLNVRFDNYNLELNLYEHVVPMLGRLTNHIQTANSLLKDIQTEYSKIFEAVLKANIEVEKCFNLPHISKEETGYLVLYFARCTEYLNRKFKIFIICTSGLGTSELLRVKVEKTFSNIIVLNTLSTNQLKKTTNLESVDFILSTVDLKNMVDAPYLLVNALFLNEDKRRVEKLMQEIINDD